MFDVIIIGSGPAGISAALYTARSNLKTLIITNGKSTLEKAEKIDNYYGFANGITGHQLYLSGIEGAKNLGVTFEYSEVVGLSYENNLIVQTKDQNYEAQFVLIATGSSRNTPNIKGIKEYEGKGISYCAICDAFFYRGKNVAVLGSGEYALHEIETLLPVASSVTLLTNSESIRAKFPKEVKLENKKIKWIKGNEKLEKITFDDDSEIDVDGLFIAYGVAGSTSLARKIGAEINGNKIVINENMQTNIPGLYAAGDCTGGLLQVSKAVYEGAKAGSEISKAFRSNKINQQ